MLINDTLINFLKELTLEAGELTLKLRKAGLKIAKKRDNSPVSNADLEASHLIAKKLEQYSPNIPIICEEREKKTLLNNVEYFWLVDPIDGTRNFIDGDNNFTINIALIQKDTPIIGFVYQPALGKLFFTNKANEAKFEEFGKEQALEINSRKDDEYKAIVGSNNLNAEAIEFIKQKNINQIFAISSSIKFCLLANQYADIYPKFGDTMEWDTAAGHAILKASGGQVLDANDMELKYGKKNFSNPHFIASNRKWLAKDF